MQLEIHLSEIQQFISKQYKVNVALKNLEVNKIEATYIDSVVLIIDEVKDNLISFHYEVDGLATIVTKVAHLFLGRKLDKTPIEWDSKNRELKIDLNKFKELDSLLEFVSISELLFIKNSIVLKMSARGEE